MAEQKIKGVVDVVFLIDVTGSMQTCIDQLKDNIAKFVDTLTGKDANNSNPVKDWRAKIVGYRDYDYDDHPPIVDHPFVRDADQLKEQLGGLVADGGHDEPESLLDGLYKVATMGQLESPSEPEDPNRWRYLYSAKRVVVVFTDASYKPTLSCPEARGAQLDDVRFHVQSNKIVLIIFSPDMDCYIKLAEWDKVEWEPIQYDKSDDRGAQKALAAYTSNKDNFRKTLEQLAKTVSQPMATPVL